MPEAFSTPNLVALPITSQELDRGGFFPPTKIVLSNSPTTIGLTKILYSETEGHFIPKKIFVHLWQNHFSQEDSFKNPENPFVLRNLLRFFERVKCPSTEMILMMYLLE